MNQVLFQKVCAWTGVVCVTLFFGAFAFVILSDSRPQPLFPRWLGFLNIWAPISFTPGILLPFFKSGPFAWNGLFVIWIPAFIFILWFVLTAKMVARAIDDEQAGTRSGRVSSPMAAT